MTSSFTPGTAAYSWTISSIFTHVIALPLVELSNILRRGLPIVSPKPRGSGSTATFP